MDLLTALLMGIGVVCLVCIGIGLKQMFSAPSDPMKTRLDTFVVKPRTALDRVLGELRPREEEKQRRRRRQNDLLPLLSKWLANTRIQFLNNLASDLTRIGSNWRASEVLYFSTILALVVFIPLAWFISWFIALVVAGGIFVLPLFYVRFLANRWIRTFEQQLADTFMMMANSIRAGYGFQQAMEMIAREGMPPISEEFAKVIQEVNLGAPWAEAFEGMVRRVQSADLELAVASILISQQVGGNLSEILTTISETIRERVRIRAEISALTAQGRLSGIILAMLPIGLAIMLTVISKASGAERPWLEPLFNTREYGPYGPWIVGYGVVSEIVGFFVIQRIVSIEI